MLKQGGFVLLKAISQDYYNLLLNNVAKKIYNNKATITDFMDIVNKENKIYRDLVFNIVDLGYNDLVEGNYEKVEYARKHLKMFNYSFDDLLYEKLKENGNYKIISDVLVDKVKLEHLKNSIIYNLFPRENNDKMMNNTPIEQEIVNKIIDSNKEESIRKMYLDKFVRVSDEVIRNINEINSEERNAPISNCIKEIFHYQLIDNKVISKDTFIDYIKNNSLDNFLFLSGNNNLNLLKYLDFSDYEIYKLVKDNIKHEHNLFPKPFFKDAYSLENLYFRNFKDCEVLKEEKEYLTLNDYNLDITGFSKEKIEILKETISFILNNKTNKISEDMLNKLNTQLNTEMKIENLTKVCIETKAILIKDVSEKEFIEIQNRNKSKIIDDFANKIREL